MSRGTPLRRLLGISSPPLSDPTPDRLDSAAGPDLAALLAERNGFVAFNSALVVRSIGSQTMWNAPSTWRDAYEDLVGPGWFFAEDAFGGQFVLDDAGVHTFDPETAERELIARDLDGWAQRLLDDGDFLTGESLATAWQRTNGPLPWGYRLLPTVPFVLGGAFEVANLFSVADVEGMRFRGDLALQIRDLPDGASVELKVVD